MQTPPGSFRAVFRRIAPFAGMGEVIFYGIVLRYLQRKVAY